MTWVLVSVIVLFAAIFVVANIRVWKTESIRVNCLDMACMLKRNHVAGSAKSIIAEAAEYEEFVRKGPPQEKPPSTEPSTKTLGDAR